MAAAPEVMNLGEDRFSAPDCSKPTFSQHTRWKNLRATRGAEARGDSMGLAISSAASNGERTLCAEVTWAVSL